MKADRLAIFFLFAAIGALTYGWWYNNQRIIAAQQLQIEKFINAGPRFTAKDGQELCLRVAFLEKQSIGFRKSGSISTPCHYYEDNR